MSLLTGSGRDHITAILFWLTLICLSAGATAAPGSTKKDWDSHPGKVVYEKHCANCHGATGQGSEPWYPALQRLAALSEPSDMVSTILTGRFRRAGEVRGHTIPIMPAWGRLSNEEIRDIVNYVQSRWGTGKKSALSTETVAALRLSPQGLSDTDSQALEPLTAAQSRRAQALYFDYCVGCHGADRLGASGPPLSAWLLQQYEPLAVQSIIHYGSSEGMPGWGVADDLSAQGMALLARYLREPTYDTPDFHLKDAQRSLTVTVPIKQRPVRPQNSQRPEQMFVSLLHDIGAVLLLDGNTKKVITQVRTDYAPHAITIDREGHYLFVLSRGGRIHQIDLWSNPPVSVAHTRVGFEARDLQIVGQGTNVQLIASAMTPGAVLILDPQSLQTIRYLKPTQGGDRLHEVVPAGNDVFVLGKDQGCVYHFDYTRALTPLKCIPSPKHLRHGTQGLNVGPGIAASADDELLFHYVLADQTDSQTENAGTTLHIPGMVGAGVGALFEHPTSGSEGSSQQASSTVWAISNLVSDKIYFIGKPGGNLSLLHTQQGLGAGSLHVTGHPESDHLWVDTPLNPNASVAGSVLVLDKSDWQRPGRMVDIAEIASVGTNVRVLHPQFNHAGDEVWLTVWNKQNEEAAIVVMNDSGLTLKQVIKDWRLTTPTRTFSLADLLR